MSVSNIIKVTFGPSTLVFTPPYYKYNSGIYLKFTDLDLPTSYQVHFANSNTGTSLEMVGTSDGVLIPDDVWQSGATIYAWLYLHPTDDSSVTKYEVRIPVSGRADLPDGTEPTEQEQTTIDTLVTALNTAVEDAQTAQASIENMTVSAESLAEGSTATVTKTETDDVVNLHFGIPVGATGATGASGADGSDGVGIASTVLNSDYTLTITLTDGTSYTTPSIRGASGADGTDGSDGNGIASVALNADYTLTLTFTDGTSYTTTSIRGEQGETGQTGATGATPSFSIGTVTTLEPTESATATITGTDENPVLNLGIPQGDKGETGEVTTAELLKAFPTDTASGSVASFSDGANLPLKALTVAIEPSQDTSGGDPSPTNICPISGWTGMSGVACGVNIWDEEWEVGGFYNATGLPWNTSDRIRTKNFMPVPPNASLYTPISLNSLCFYDSSKAFISGGARQSGVFVTPSNAAFARFATYAAYGTTYNNDISINYPSTDTSYHPYTLSKDISIQFGQTVYGGKLDVLTGVLTVTHGIVTLTSSMSWYSGYRGYYTQVSDMHADSDNFTSVKCSHFATLESADTGSGIYCTSTAMYFRRINSDYATKSDWTTFLDENAVKVVYPLATPTTIQLTAQEVSSLLGDNNIFADTGDTSVEYYADPTLYISKKITEAISALS